MQSGADAAVRRPMLQVARQGRPQARFEARGSQFPDAKGDVLIELPGELLERFELRAEVGPFERLRFEHLQRQPQSGELLAELIVELARDSTAFVFLRQDEPGQQPKAFPFDALSLGHLRAKRLVGD